MFVIWKLERYHSLSSILLTAGFLLRISLAQRLSPLTEAATMYNYGVTAFAALHGMELTVYYVTTEDNWRLQVHRVRSPKIFNRTFSTPVLVAHGTVATSANFMINSRSESLAFILADNGYDVWLVNNRGVQFSLEKVTDTGVPYKAYGSDMYETAWQFMAQYDMPAFLDLILRETGHEKLHIVAHSQGGANVLAFFAADHSYDDKVGNFVAMAPTVLLGDDMSPFIKFGLTILAPIIENLPKPLFEVVMQIPVPGMYQSFLDQFVYPFCYFFPSTCTLGSNFIQQRGIVKSLISTPDFDKARATVTSTISPGGLTVMTVYQVSAQIRMTQKAWTKMDYRKIPQAGITNQEMYNSTEPPAFNFTNARLNTSLVFASNDVIFGVGTALEIVDWLKPANSLLLDEGRLTHAGLVSSWRAPCLVYGFLLKQLTDFDNSRSQGHEQYRRQVAHHMKSLEEPRCATQDYV